MQLIINSENSESGVVKLIGELDAQGCKEIRGQLEALVDSSGNQELALDMDEVSFIDSSGLGAIVFLFKRLRATDGNLILINVHGQPLELLTLLRVHEAISINQNSATEKNSAA